MLNEDVYFDRYVEKEFKYVNDTIGFSLTFDESWTVYSDLNLIPWFFRKVWRIEKRAKMVRESGGELIFFAEFVKPDFMVIGKVEPSNESLGQIYKTACAANYVQYEDVLVELVKLGHTEMVSMVYTVKKGKHKSQEYEIKKGQYKIKLIFYTESSLFEVYKDIIHKIASTFRSTDY